jgi:hypothetical protein
MAGNRRRDPYKAFNFLVPLGAAVSAVAAVAIFRRLFAKVEYRAPGVYVEETPTGVRPIEGVGTSTAGFAGPSPKRTTRQSARKRGARKPSRRKGA